MAYSIDVVVVEIKADFDPYGGEYTMVSFGYKLPIPLPLHVDKVFPLHRSQFIISMGFMFLFLGRSGLDNTTCGKNIV